MQSEDGREKLETRQLAKAAHADGGSQGTRKT